MAVHPFASRPDLDPAKLHISFLPIAPTPESIVLARSLPCAPDEWHVASRELYLYFPAGLGRPTLSIPKLERILGTHGTARNWNTLNKLLEIAEKLE